MHPALVVVRKNLNDVVENSMIIILKRIPKHTRKADIIQHLAPVLKGGLLKPSGSIESVNILGLRNSHTNNIEIHALVSIDSDKAAARVIKKLNRKELKGKNIGIAEYQNRSWQNDPRLNTEDPEPDLESKRATNRRHAKLQDLSTLPANLSEHDDFNWK
jgi:hypothetical protein